MYAYIKNGVLDSYSEELFHKHVPATETEDEEWNVVTIPETPGLVYDEAIEFDFDDVPVFEGGKIVPYSESRKKIEDDLRILSEEDERKKSRKSEILEESWRLSNERAGLVALGAKASDVTEIDAKIETLRIEYLSLTA